MPSKIQKSLAALLSHIKQSKSRRTKIVGGQGVPGHRAAPAPGGNHDATIGGRIDVGEIVKIAGKEFRRYKFHLNLNAQDSTIKKMAAKSSHKVYSTADVEIKGNRSEAEEEKAMEEFEQQLYKNLME